MGEFVGTSSKLVISFSLYGRAACYQTGALANIELARQIYPGWTCRFYVSQEIPEQFVSRLESSGGEVVRRYRSRSWRPSADPMLWRFLPASESGIDRLIVRDTDSRLTARERAAVEEWISSSRALHIMRDHPYHNQPILGGLWGCRGGILPNMERLIRRWEIYFVLTGGWVLHRRGWDQVFLGTMVYPRLKNDAMIHSSSTRYIGETTVPFPTPREGLSFVGESFRDQPSLEGRMKSLLAEAGTTMSPVPEYRLLPRAARKMVALLRVYIGRRR